jgi:phospholipid-transporting ATPase
MCFLPAYAAIAPLVGLSLEYTGIVNQLWTNWIFYLMMILIPAICLARDYVWK